MTIRIVTDSTCDLPQEITTRYGVHVIPLYIHIGEKQYRDTVDLSRMEFYQQLPGYESFPTTAAPSTETFRQVYDRLAAEGATQVLSIHISVSLSATVDVARVAAQETTSVPVTVFDSRQLSLGMGYLVETAAKTAAEGRTMEEILARLEDQISRTHVFAALDTLEFLRRSGRMNSVVAGLGSLLQIKPLLKMYDGNPTSERVRTNNGAFQRLVDLLSEQAPFEQVALVHTHAPQSAKDLSRKVQPLLPEGEILSVDITPVIGAHIGPGAVGFACVQARST